MGKAFLEETNRDYTELTQPDQIAYVIKKYLTNKKVHIKDIPQQIMADIELLPNNHIRLYFSDNTPNEYKNKSQLKIYTIANRYVEIAIKKSNFSGSRDEFEPTRAKIATTTRKEPRISVDQEFDFLAENFRFSKYYLGPNMMEVPICVQVAFDNIREDFNQSFPDGDLVIVDKIKSSDRGMKAVLKTSQTLYIKDSSDENSFTSEDPDFLDYSLYLSGNLQAEMENYEENKLKSLLVYPIKYTNLMGEGVILGFFKFTSSSESISKDIIPKLEEFSGIIREKIRDANIQIFNQPQKIMNVSKSGLQVQVQNKDMFDTMLASRNELVVDIRPKVAFRFGLYIKIVCILVGEANDYNVGMRIIGGEQRRGLDSWHKYVEKLINTHEVF